MIRNWICSMKADAGVSRDQSSAAQGEARHAAAARLHGRVHAAAPHLAQGMARSVHAGTGRTHPAAAGGDLTALWLAHLLVPVLHQVPRTALCRVGWVRLHLHGSTYCLTWRRV